MKKALLLLVTAVVAGVLILGCAQPEFDGSSLNVNNYGVEAPQNVAATAYTGAVRVTWDAPKTPVSGYRVIRKIKDSDAEPVTVQSTNGTTYWTVDNVLSGPTKLENGQTYIYKVVAYNNAGQGVGAITAESEEKEVVAIAPAPGSVLALPATPTLEVVGSYPSSSAAGTTTSTYNLKVSGLDPAYSYQYRIEQNDTPATVAGWVTVITNWSNLTPSALNTATFDGTDYINVNNADRNLATGGFRVLVRISANGNDWSVSSTYLNTATDPTVNYSNIVEIGRF
jgi:hypothetical protein